MSEIFLQQSIWPTEDKLEEFYGRPWEDLHLLGSVFPPWPMWASWDHGQRITRLTVHRLCVDSLDKVLRAIWDACGREYDRIVEWGMHLYGGGYSHRNIRGGKSLSMHAYGCAVDFDPARNGLGNRNPNFGRIPEVLAAWDSECWYWGGHFASRPDGMHWEAVWHNNTSV